MIKSTPTSYRRWISVLLIAVFTTACNGTPAPTSTPTEVVIPTDTPVSATETPLPTMPTVMPSPTPTPVSGSSLVVPFAMGTAGVTTDLSYAGIVPVTVSGSGQASGGSWSDAFYVYTDHEGQEVPPWHPTTFYNWSLWINGAPADELVVGEIPPYNPAHVYTLEISAPGGLLHFAVGDEAAADNTGAYTVTLAGGSLPALPVILSFTVDRTTIVQGESVTLSWQATGGDEACLAWPDAFGLLTAGLGPLDPDAGSVTITPDTLLKGFSVLLRVTNSAGSANARVDITQECAHEWADALTSDPPTYNCPGGAAYGSAAQQTFEDGFMIWLETSRTIYVFHTHGQPQSPSSYYYQTFADEFREGDPESDPAIVPPPGLYQPIRGFGLVWRTHQEVRDSLGWATEPEVGFQSWEQGFRGTGMHSSTLLMEGIDGTTYLLSAIDSSWQVYAP